MANVPMDRVRYRRADGVIEVVGQGRFDVARDGAIVLPIEILRDASLNDLNVALRSMSEEGGFDAIFLTDAPWDDYDPDGSPRAEPEVMLDPLDPDHVDVNAVTYLEDGHEPPEAELRGLVQPLLDRHGATWGGIWTDYDQGPGLVIGVGATLPARRHTAGQLFDLGQDLSDLLGAYSGVGGLTARSVLDLVRGGRAAVLVGQREGTWLEVKEPPYALQTPKQRFEVAKDVAAFANAGQDALIVQGLRTVRDRNGDIIAAARPFDLDGVNVEALRAVLRDNIVPTILDLDIGVVETADGYGYSYIFIPAQTADALPYLVAGAIVGDAINGAHVSIPYRAGEDTAFADAARVHSLIVAGRAALGA